ncbi:MAG: nicotinate-nucleotide--dimethylbenzimidazole phosphoribosyltransferase [Kordiimonadaceae bacterium]|nr:nicotinate-nucleotide--dimethylbenzimidazole phosphoribosyltransferase [Kordiimonadaceae bacterium]
MSAPFDDLRQVFSQLPTGDTCAAKKITQYAAEKNLSEDDELLSIKSWLSTWQGTATPSVAEAHICILASSYEGHENSAVKALISAAAKGSAPVNRLCIDQGVGLRVLELAPEIPHKLGMEGWTEAECMAAVAFGMEATAAGGDLLALSDIAPGNKASALAIVATCSKGESAAILEQFAGDKQYSEVIQQAKQLEAKQLGAKLLEASLPEDQGANALSIMQLLGGREIAASVGALIAARSRRLPVLVDGWAGLAAIAIMEHQQVGSSDHVKLASCDCDLAVEMASLVGKKPLLSLNVATGPGCGSAISVTILKAACDI